MIHGSSRLLTNFALVILMALVAVSCGRRGNLEPPPSAAVISVDENGNEIEETRKPEKPNEPFFLDPLL
jgi:predicted small lipoprotein YifL